MEYIVRKKDGWLGKRRDRAHVVLGGGFMECLVVGRGVRKGRFLIVVFLHER